MGEKRCSKCGEVKDLSAFEKDKSRKDGLHPQCKGCKKAYQKANADKIAEYKKAYHKANADNLTDGYVSNAIGLPIHQIPPAFIEAKRIQLKIHRMTKQLQS